MVDASEGFSVFLSQRFPADAKWGTSGVFYKTHAWSHPEADAAERLRSGSTPCVFFSSFKSAQPVSKRVDLALKRVNGLTGFKTCQVTKKVSSLHG